MRTKLIILAVYLALIPAAGRAAPIDADAKPVAELLERARLWEAKGRDDIAKQSLQKIFLIAPDNPKALALMGMLDARTGNADEAKRMLEHLQRVAPNHPDILRIQDLLRLYGPDKDKLRQARLLASSGRKTEALAKFRALYPNGPPDGSLALEYWQLVAGTPQGFEPARRELSKLSRENPNNLGYRIALAKLETSHLPLNRQALNTLIDMSSMPDYAREAKSAWRSAILRLGNDASGIPLLKAYLEQDPADTAVRQQLDASIKARTASVKAAEEKRRLEADPYYQAGQAGIALLDSGNLDAAAKRLAYSLSGRGDDADMVGAMGLLRFKQGYDFEAQGYFLRALKLDPSRSDKWTPLLNAARFWGLMKEYGDAVRAGEPDLAEMKLRQALAIKPNESDALAALGHVLFDKGNIADAEKAYHKAIATESANSSALGGLVSLYLKTGRAQDAKQLLANLSEKQKTALGTSLNSLKSSMLKQEADMLAAAGNSAEAVRDLEQAVNIDPNDPWLRYALAQRYIQGGDRAKVQPLFDDYFRSHPGDATGLYAYALLQSSMDEDTKALDTLNRIAPSGVDEKIAAFKKRLQFGMQGRQARDLIRSGAQDKAEKLLEQMQREAQGDIELTTQAAYAWADAGKIARARQILSTLEAGSASLDADWHLRYANFLDGIDAEAALGQEFDRIAALGNLSPEQMQSLRNLKESRAIKASEVLRKSGKLDEAQLALAPYLANDRNGVNLLLEEAKIAVDTGRTQTAEEDYRHILAANPSNPDALEGLVGLYLNSGRVTDAEKVLTGLSAGQKTAMGKSFTSLKSSLLRQEAEMLDAAGNRQMAVKDLTDAIALDPDDPWLRFDLAKLYVKAGDRASAQSTFDDYFARHPGDATGRYAYALLQASMDQDEQALATLDSVPSAQRSPKIAQFRTELVETIAVRQSDALRGKGQYGKAKSVLSPLLAADPDSPRLLFADARINMDEKNHRAAEADYRHILAMNPVDNNAREGLADALVNEGHLLAALDQVDAWLARKETRDTPTRLEEVNILIKLEDYPSARKKLSALLALEPGNSEALALADRITAHENPAFQPYPVAKLMESDASLPSWLHRKEESAQKSGRLSNREVEQQNDKAAWLSSAVDLRSRSGTAGVSQFGSLEIPLEYKTPVKTGQVFLRMDAVRLDAGTLNANASDTKAFGTLLLCQPNCPANDARQQADGASFTAGYSNGPDLRLDIGTTPLGFPVRHIVGGILKKGDLGPFSYSVDLSRRALTSTLLSFAGTRDPRTGLTWGGVVATGPRLGLSLDNGGEFGAWSSLEYHKLTGTNVQSNTRIRLMAGGYWRAINEEDMELSLGLTGMLWRYKVDAGEFSYGHGGYYSPQRYASLSVPVSFGQRIANFSYVLRASVSTSYSRFDAAPYYPTDQALQAQGNSYYSASSGPGHGYSFLANWEYLITPELYLGGQFNIERSVYYAPNHLLVYLRHPIGGTGAQQVSLPPYLFEPTSQF